MVTFKDLCSNSPQENNTFTFNDKVIAVKRYMSARDKNDIITIAIQKSYEHGIYKAALVEAYFTVFTIFSYTDIEFTDDDKNMLLDVYDTLNANGFVKEFWKYMEESEVEQLRDMLAEDLYHVYQYRASAAGFISSLTDNLPDNINAVQNLIKDFDPAQYAQVLNFAAAVNNGNIPDNITPIG